MLCITCSNNTTNPKFCSRSCANTYNNREFPKRKPEGVCRECKTTPVPVSRYTICKICRANRPNPQSITLFDLRERSGGKSNRFYNFINYHSRKVYFSSNKPKCCSICGYDRHFEIHHILASSKFPDTTTVAEVNDLANLIALCPNHHWEVEHEILTP